MDGREGGGGEGGAARGCGIVHAVYLDSLDYGEHGGCECGLKSVRGCGEFGHYVAEDGFA